MKCRKCGAEVTGKYCSECGKKVTNIAADYIRTVNKRGRDYVFKKGNRYNHPFEGGTADFSWNMARNRLETADPYRLVLGNRYEGELNPLVDRIEAEADRLYEQILPLVQEK